MGEHRENESDAQLDEGRRAALAGETVGVAEHLEVVRARPVLMEATARRIRRHHLDEQMGAKPREGSARLAVWKAQMDVRREAHGVPGGVEDESLAEERVDLLDDARVVDERLETAAVLALPDIVELAPAVEHALLVLEHSAEAGRILQIRLRKKLRILTKRLYV